MLTLSQYLSFEGVIVGLYVAGFAVISPPLAWGGLAVGWGLNRGQPLAPRLAGALLAAVVGAYLAMCWLSVAGQHPAGDAGTLLAALGDELAWPFTFLHAGNLNGAIVCAAFYLPALLALLLYGLARRYEEAIDDWLSRAREQRAETRQARAEKRAERRQARADRRALVPAADFEAASSPAVPTAGGVVLSARAGEPVMLPAGLVMDGETRPAVIIEVQAPAPATPIVLPRYGRGYIVGTCIAVYYLAATASRLWLPLLALGLWFFGPSLLAYEQHQLAAMLNDAARALKPW